MILVNTACVFFEKANDIYVILVKEKIMIYIIAYILVSFCLAMFIVYLTAKDKIYVDLFPFLFPDEPGFNALLTFLGWEVILLIFIIMLIGGLCKKFFEWFYNCFKEE